jgi:cytochrome c oxidase subunit IV
MMETAHEDHHIMGFGTCFAVWGALLGLTALLVAVNSMGIGGWGLLATLFISPLKAGLIFYFFMHLKYESPLLKVMVFGVLATLVIFVGLMFTDYSFR